VGLLIEALQASVWCLHELRIEYDTPGTLAAGISPKPSPRDAAAGKSGDASPRTPRGGKPVLQVRVRVRVRARARARARVMVR